MNLRGVSTKEIGRLGERVAGEYLRRHGFVVAGTNIRSKFGEIDIVAKSREIVHIIEVKSRLCKTFPDTYAESAYDPGDNLHRHKINKVARMGFWYVDMIAWEGEWQVDGLLVWLRERDGMARISYYPQLL